jgi:hypothetical protein
MRYEAVKYYWTLEKMVFGSSGNFGEEDDGFGCHEAFLAARFQNMNDVTTWHRVCGLMLANHTSISTV